MERRQFLTVVGTTLGLAPVVAWIGGPALANRGGSAEREVAVAIRKTAAEWRSRLTPEQYYVLREHGTERAGSSPLNHENRSGIFVCAGCGHPVFSSEAKFESGTGWPSFFAPLDAAVRTRLDRSFFMVRTEVLCSSCGGHLGHVFSDGPRPTGLRYCMNGVALRFTARA